MPTTTRGSSVPSPSLSPSTPASLRRSTASCSRSVSPPSVAPETRTRSLGHLSRTVPAGRRAMSSAASAIASATVAASCQIRSGASQAGRNPRHSSRADPGGASHGRPSRPRPSVCSSATARQTSGVPSRSQARTTSFVDADATKRSTRPRNGGRPRSPVAGLTTAAVGRSPCLAARPRSAPVAPARRRAWRARSGLSTRPRR